MPVKKILFGVLCVLLVTVVVMTCVAVSRVGTMLSALLSMGGQGAGTQTPSTSGTQTQTPTTQPSQPDPTQPSQSEPPATDPTEPEHVHEYELVETVEAGCETLGYETYYCAGCGRDDYRNFVDPLGHAYGPAEWIEATCETSGCQRATCARCGIVTEWDHTDPMEHQPVWVETVVPTCTDGGYDLYQCSNCGQQTLENEVPALGHDMTVVVELQAPTCTEPGRTIYQCSLCGTLHEETLPMTEHSYSQWVTGEDGVMYRICQFCGSTDSGATLAITGEYMKEFAAGSKLYLIYVGTPEEPEIFYFTIWDYLNNGTLSYRLDMARGLVVTYTDPAGETVEITQAFGDTTAVRITAE